MKLLKIMKEQGLPISEVVFGGVLLAGTIYGLCYLPTIVAIMLDIKGV